MQTLTIIVVSYNTRELTHACLESVYRETGLPDFEVIVVDNASTDGSAEMIRSEFPQVRLLALDENVGFAAANNRAAELADGRYLLLLNPDTVILNSAIDTLLQFAINNPNYGIYGGATVYGDGTRNPTSGWKKPTWWSLFTLASGMSSALRGSRLFDSESLARSSWNAPLEVDIVTGCFLLTTADLWRTLGGFDPQFEMYGEDADFCLRAKALGARPLLVPEAEIVHYGGASDPVRANKMIRLMRAKAQLFRKHWSKPGAIYAVTMLRLWALSRGIAYWLIRWKSEQGEDGFRAWNKVWRQRDQWVRPSRPSP